MRKPFETLAISVTSILLVGGAPQVRAITVLSESIDPIQINQGNQGLAKAIGSFDITSGDGTSGSASGSVLIDGSGSVWVLTAAHVLADVGAVIEDTDVTPAVVNFSLGNNFFASSGITVAEWFVPEPYDGTVVSKYDIALARLDLDRSEYNGPSLPIFSRPDNDQALAELIGEEVVFVGFGTTGTGLTGSVEFDGLRRVGRNQIDSVGDAEGFILTTDFDIDRDDELYDVTPEDFTDRNPLIELSYTLQNFGEFTVSGGVEPRQFPELDFRVPFESSVTPGDSGGAILVGGAVAGVTSFGDVDDNDNGGFFTQSQGFVSTSPWANWLVSVIGQVEAAQTPFGADGVGVLRGAPDEISILEAKEEAEMAPEDNTLVFNSLITSYYLGDSLSIEDKMKLLNYITVSDNDAKTTAEVLAIINDPAVSNSSQAVALLNQKLTQIYGAPTFDRALDSTQRYYRNLFNYTALHRGDVTPPVFVLGDLDGNGRVDPADIDLILQGIADGEEWADYNFDLVTDQADLAALLAETGVLSGDADLDGFIAQADLDAVLLNWGQNGTGWAGGDFDGDGIVAQADLDAVLLNWGVSAEPGFNGSGVPEPTAAALLGLSALALLRRR